MGLATNVEAEAKAIQMTLRTSVEMGWHNITLEADSTSLVHIITGRWKCPWDLSEVIGEIITNMHKQEAVIQHIFRKRNQLADYLSNLAYSHTSKKVFLSFKELPSSGRKIMNIDKSQIPYVRVKTKEIRHARIGGKAGQETITSR